MASWTFITWNRTVEEANRASEPWGPFGEERSCIQAGPGFFGHDRGSRIHPVRIDAPTFLGDDALLRIAREVRGDYVLFATGDKPVFPREPFFRRLFPTLENGAWDCCYMNHFRQTTELARESVCLPRFQEGSARDTFPMGPLLAFRADAFKTAASSREGTDNLLFAALQRVLLNLAGRGRIGFIPEPLYNVGQGQPSSEAQFDYQRRENEERQSEMESVFTRHLYRTGAWMPPPPKLTRKSADSDFPVTASVIIPVRNRARTIGESIESAARQEAPFPFNVLVVDNHSTDGTSAIVEDACRSFGNVVRLCPPDVERGIGGCWQLAIMDPRCGRFAVQLDSDDLYEGPDAVSRIVQCLSDTESAMAVGAYRLVDMNRNEIPPGVIAHREWTDENGHNNLLRVEGIGAPRAYDVNMLRRIGFPDVSYGEDYAVALAVSARYRVGRIFDPLYLCRRWEGNSDADTSPAKVAFHHEYKDFLRSCELRRRRSLFAERSRAR